MCARVDILSVIACCLFRMSVSRPVGIYFLSDGESSSVLRCVGGPRLLGAPALVTETPGSGPAADTGETRERETTRHCRGHGRSRGEAATLAAHLHTACIRTDISSEAYILEIY